MGDANELDFQEHQNVIVKEEVDLDCEYVTAEGCRHQELEWVTVKQEPCASTEEETPEHILEFEFVSVKEEREKKQQLTLQDFEFVSVKEESKNDEHLMLQAQNSEVTAAHTRWFMQRDVDNQVRETREPDVSCSFLDSKRDRESGSRHCGGSIASVQSEDVLQMLTCAICSAVFMSKYSLIRHVFFHIDGVLPPSYVCEICGDVFPRSTDLNHHIVICKDSQYITHNSNTVTKPSECVTFCKTFSNPKNLQHNKRDHTKEKPHMCTICGKSYKRSAYLQAHKRIHTGERKYQCDICGNKFFYSGHLISHKQIHTGEKPHKCDICGKTFYRSGSLNKHKSRHTGEKLYNCKACGKKFFRAWCLEVHKLTHTGEKPHEWEDFFTSLESSNS